MRFQAALAGSGPAMGECADETISRDFIGFGRGLGGGPGASAGPGSLRHQLGRRGRAWRLLPGARRRHLQEVWARRDHRARRAEREQPHPVAGRQARLLHERQFAANLRRGRAQYSGRGGGGELPEGPAGADRASGRRQARRPEDAHFVRLQGRHGHLFSMAEGGLRLRRVEGETLHLQRAAVPRRQEFGDGRLRHLGALRDREAGAFQAGRVPAGRSRLQQLFDVDRDAARSGRQTARSGAALRRCLGDRLVSLPLRRCASRQCADQAAEPGNDRRPAGLFHRADEAGRHRRFRRYGEARHRRHDRRALAELLRQDGARRRGESRSRLQSAATRCNSSTRASASSCGPNDFARLGDRRAAQRRQDVRQRHGRARRLDARRARRRIRVAARSLRLRQVDGAAHRRRLERAERRHGRMAGRRRSNRFRVPGADADALGGRRRQCAAAAETRTGGRGKSAQRGDAGADRTSGSPMPQAPIRANCPAA